jgi:flagellar biosynthesis protein FlhF
MKIRRFFAPDMRQAIRMVREEQGPDAVILSSRRVDGGMEIVSAIDYDPALVSDLEEDAALPPDVAGADGVRASRELEAEVLEPLLGRFSEESLPARKSPEPAREREIVWSQDPTLTAMRREIETLRSMLQDQLGSLAWNDIRQRQPERAQVIGDLLRLGLDEELARELALAVEHTADPERMWREALGALADRIPVAGEERLVGKGVVALVGPTGVGKTTTIAKLAARHVRRMGRQSVALITTDSHRVGAYRQLQTFGQILGIPVYLAQTARDLGGILAGLGDKDRVFVDTAGMSQRDLQLAGNMAGLNGIPNLRTLLVVATNAQQAVLEETLRAFGQLPLEGIVLTKLDEAVSLGPILTALSRGDLPLMFVSEGQRVPEDLNSANVERLINLAVALSMRHGEVDDRERASPQGLREFAGWSHHAHASA